MGARRGRERVVAVLAGAVACLVALEIGLRLLGATTPQPLPQGSWSEGAVACPACVRVLCLGDSFTYGIGASPGADYPAALERILAERLGGGSVLVVRAGFGGGNTSGILERTPAWLAAVQPQVVVLLAGATNHVNLFGYEAWRRRSTVIGEIERALFRVRSLRLVRHVAGRLMSRGDALADRPLLDRGSLRAALEWRRRHPEKGPPKEAFLEGLDLLALGRDAEAVRVFERAVQAEPTDGSLLWGLGRARQAQRLFDDAERWFRAAAEADPTDPNPWRSLGEMELERGSVSSDEALARFDKGIAADPSLAGNWCGRGVVLLRQGRGAEALEALLNGIRVDPEDPCCYDNLVGPAGFPVPIEEILRRMDEASGGSALARSHASLGRPNTRGAAIERWVRSDLGAIVDGAQATGARVVMQTYPGPSPTNDTLRDVARGRGLPLVDQEAVFTRAMAEQGLSAPDLFLPDGHCNDRGYRLMAEALAERLVDEVLEPVP